MESLLLSEVHGLLLVHATLGPVGLSPIEHAPHQELRPGNEDAMRGTSSLSA